MYPALYRNQLLHNLSKRSYNRPFPLVNVKNEEQNLVLEVIAPGRKKENFKVEVKNNILSISSDSKTELTEQYRSAEFQLVPFKRSFKLVSEFDTENIKAAYNDGILYVTLPKKNAELEQPAKVIEIQ
jgi:HSP20 family protein